MGSNKPSTSTATPTSTPAIEANASSNGSNDVWTQVKAGVKELIHVATEGLRTYVDPAYAALGPVVFLGRKYAGLKDPAFVDDFQSRFWVTYRHSFPPIAPSSYTSDVGWGCMMRSGQMLLANALVYHLLGRDWRLSKNSGKVWDDYVKIITWFLDSNSSPYSIHRIALIGTQYDKAIGEWFGPTTIAQVLRILHEAQATESKMAMHIVKDGTLLLDELAGTCTRRDTEDGKEGWSAVLILVPVRLGLDSLNSVYHGSIKKFFEFSSSVGIAGGRPNSSLYFMGVEGENHLIYTDPHFMRQTIDLKDPAAYSTENLETYHCTTVRIVPISSLDPSMVFGFYCRNKQEVDQFVKDAKKDLCSGGTPLFSIQDTAPNYENAEVLSDNSDGDF
ncbi:UNVERIFIED_CONTAM: Cysteine protease atg4b [Siphonaria sp. JEL0065]|nr:Cysteine protease atg4b [Siphonaria sp. JEL0065]